MARLAEPAPQADLQFQNSLCSGGPSTGGAQDQIQKNRDPVRKHGSGQPSIPPSVPPEGRSCALRLLLPSAGAVFGSIPRNTQTSSDERLLAPRPRQSARLLKCAR